MSVALPKLTAALIIAGFFITLFSGAEAQAQEPAIVGKWQLRVDTPRGLREPILTVKSDLSATLNGPRGEQVIEKVEAEGNSFSFPLIVSIPIGTMEMTYAGQIDGDTLVGNIGNARGTIPFSGRRVPD